MAAKKKTTADKIKEQETRLSLLRAKDAYEKAKAAAVKK
jgi:hypothetical protein